MRTILIVFFCIFFSHYAFAQDFTRPERGELDDNLFNTRDQDSIDKVNPRGIKIKLSGETHYTDYKVISYNHDTTYIDTTLSMRKDYKFNYLRKDDFELMAFSNQGQTYTSLGYDFSSDSYIPQMGMTAKHFNYKEVKDITYYEVPTPTTELMYRTGLEQGQVVDALLTMNMSRQFNISFEYKGLRSLGKYRQTLSSVKNFRPTFSYYTKDKRYYARGHFAAHHFLNQENGGLTDQSIAFFETNDPSYKDRGRLEVNFIDAENILESKRYHLEHNFKIFKENDSIPRTSNLKVGHYYTYESKHYQFTQSQNDFFGESFEAKVVDRTGLRTMNNLVYLELDSPFILGQVRAKANYYNYDHYFNGVVNLVDETIDAQLKGNALSVGAEWNAQIDDFNFTADVSSIISGDIEGNSLIGAATYKKDSLFDVTARISTISKMPDFNFIHFQSDYIDYNWQNENFKNEQIRSLSIDFNSEKWGYASASITQIDNYSYFDSISKPQQATESVNYLKIKVGKAFTFRSFTLDNTIMYQNVSSGGDVFRVPEFVTRNSLFYSNHLFKKKPLYLQTGVTFKYFTEYYMNVYNPLLAEFNIQNDEQYGGYPVVDLFVNAEVSRMRIFFKIENILSRYTGRDYYSAPINPYRDFTVRFGIVWNFFI